MKYMLLIYGPEADTTAMEPQSPEMEPWNAYTQWLVDQGIHRGGERLVTDGPFAETKEVLGGYYIVECDNLDLALEAAGRCPGAAWGSIEVRPMMEM
jgi:hypothetical protein